VSKPYSENLVVFLYILMRDDVVCGRVAQIVKEHCRNHEGNDFTNKHLEAYAREIANKLAIGGPLDPKLESSYRFQERTAEIEAAKAASCASGTGDL
jgi:hypothetical protein